LNCVGIFKENHMRNKNTRIWGWQCGAILAVLACFSAGTVGAEGQTGDNVVYSGTNPTTTLVASPAFIDASTFTTGTDLCQKIYDALLTAPSVGAVIDARGITSGLNCTSGTPWFQSSTAYTNTPATILLPSGLITIHQTWILPNATRVVGEGAGSSGTGSSGTGITTIQAVSGFNGQMIQMGPNGTSTTLTPCTNFTVTGCMGVSVEDLTLDGNDSATGIINGQSREHSYVRRVYLYRIPGIGLQVWSNANFSGPYSDITFSNTSSAGASTECVWINNVSTRGVHGLNCVASGSTTPAAAVLLDGVGNSIEDVQVQGFVDGILVGKDNPTVSNVLLNIVGGSGVTNVIHICGATQVTPCPAAANVVSDLSIMSVARGTATNSIEDDLTLLTASTTLTDANVAMYAIGEPVKAAGSSVGYSRFSTSPSVPTWVVQSTTTVPTSCVAGSILSNTGGTSGHTLWVCTGSTWTNVE
jgi:hypothetical protein